MKTQVGTSLIIKMKQYNNEKYEILNEDKQKEISLHSIINQSQVQNERKPTQEPEIIHKMDQNKQIDETKSPQTIQQSNSRLKMRQQLHFSEDEIDESSIALLSCKCSRSGCLQLYCVCFQNNRKCSNQCVCSNCKNNDQHIELRKLAQQKLVRKFQRNTEEYSFSSKSTGCKCKKSKCQKKYCECYVRDKKCTALCKCINCYNDGDKLKKRNK